MGNLLLSLLVFSVSAFGSQTPQIYFRYSPGFDSVVCRNPDLIQPGEFAELTALLPAIQSAWNSRQVALFQATINIVGKEFKRTEETATLFLCRDFPAMATPLIVWGYPFLKAARGSNALNPLFIVPIAFHEVLHLYVRDLLSGIPFSPLLEKYRSEPELVRVHLHLFAIEHLVYMSVDPSGQLYATARKMDESYGPDYMKAWTIVSKEGSQSFVDELRRNPAKVEGRVNSYAEDGHSRAQSFPLGEAAN